MSELLPPSSTALERNLATVCGEISSLPVAIRDVWSPQACPGSHLPWLAWAFSVDDWNIEWTDAQKRAVIEKSLEVHKRKGTIGAVRAALAALGFDVRVQEWFNQIPAAEPYTFRLWLEVDQIGIPQTGLAQILTALKNSKNLRSHLTEIVPSVRSLNESYVAAACGVGNAISITQYTPARVVINEWAIAIPTV